MIRPLSIVASLAVLVAAFSAIAQNPPTAPAATPAPAAAAPAPAAAAPAAAAPAAGPGDIARGRSLTYTCQGCHGLTGYQNAYPTFHVPRIGGQSSEYLAQALHEYREGKRKHPTMQAQAQSFSDQDIADIAAFLSTVK